MDSLLVLFLVWCWLWCSLDNLIVNFVCKQYRTSVWSSSIESGDSSGSFYHEISWHDTITPCSTQHSDSISCIHWYTCYSRYVEKPERSMSGLISFFLIDESESCQVYIIRYITLEHYHPYGIHSIISWCIWHTSTSHRSWDLSHTSGESLDVFLIICWVLHTSISVDVLKFHQNVFWCELWDTEDLILIVSHTDELITHWSWFSLRSLLSCLSLDSLTTLLSLSSSRSWWSSCSLWSDWSSSWSLRSLWSLGSGASS